MEASSGGKIELAFCHESIEMSYAGGRRRTSRRDVPGRKVFAKYKGSGRCTEIIIFLFYLLYILELLQKIILINRRWNIGRNVGRVKKDSHGAAPLFLTVYFF